MTEYETLINLIRWNLEKSTEYYLEQYIVSSQLGSGFHFNPVTMVTLNY